MTRGVAPKHPSLRQRQNKVSTNAKMETSDSITRRPSLPKDRDWHPLVVTAWAEIWNSPLVQEYIKADIHSFMIYVDLLDRYWKTPTTSLASEVRLQRQSFGLDPLARRRLQWEIERVESKRPQKPKAKATSDPRLQVLEGGAS